MSRLPQSPSGPIGSELKPERLQIPQRDGKFSTEIFKAGRGEPLFYLHGIVGQTGWAPFLDDLAKSYCVYAPLLPGYGESQGLEVVDDVLDLTLHCLELMDVLGIQQADVVGHALGGMVAAEMAALSHHYVKRLVLVAPTGLWRDDAPATDYMAMPSEELDKILWADPNSPIAQEALALPDSQESRVELALNRIKELTTATKFLWPIPDKGLKRRLYRIKSPTLIVWGNEDRMIPVIYAQEFQRQIRHSRVEVLPQCGHMPMVEQRQAFVKLVEDFLKK